MPAATYRLQLNAGFTFDDAAAITGYLHRLGVSHLYLSPVLQAAPGSTHGYDVVDPTRVSAELGGEEGHRRLHDARRQHGLRELLDVVPNHMAIGVRQNAWWWDVLEDGPASRYAGFFDVEWDPPESKLRNLVLLPILGDQYGRELEAGRFTLEREGGAFVLRYFDHVMPLAPRSVDGLLHAAAVRLTAEGASESQRTAGEDLAAIAGALGRLPHSATTATAATAVTATADAAVAAAAAATAADRVSIPRRGSDPETPRHGSDTQTQPTGSAKETLRQKLAGLCAAVPAAADAIDGELAALQADPDALDALLDHQNYRLAWWRTAAEELDYRRFFDINDLVGLRAEDPNVFEATHRVVLDWVQRNVIEGLRIDHVDGLRDPAAYLERLAAAAPGAWLVVEKILEGDEELPADWPVAGTTGYEWLNRVGDLLVDPDGWAVLDGLYQEFTGHAYHGDEVVRQAKEAVLDGALAADLTRLVYRLSDVCERHRRYRDFTRRDLRDCLRAVIVGFGVYRTYLRAGHPPCEADVITVESAVRQAGIAHPDLDMDLLGFVKELLLGGIGGIDALDIAVRFQQLTGPVMAKAVEDTAFYRYLPLSSRNEVGGDPLRPPQGIDGFHRAAARAHERQPVGLLALSTHDTKRSEDVRGRLAVLAELPEEWNETVTRWRSHHRHRRSAPLPDANTEWLFYQTVVGAWPIDSSRLDEYLRKATREAKDFTSWTDPEPVFEEALQSFAAEALADEDFIVEVERFVERIRGAGWTNALTQKLFTLTAPGVGDIYQGSECWELSLVDPDNRRPVDYERRIAALEGLLREGPTPAELWARERGEGRSKLLVVHRALALRHAHPEWFGDGPQSCYQRLTAAGPAAPHVVAFRRGPQADGDGGAQDEPGAVSIGTRLPLRLAAAGGWRGTRLALPAGGWVDQLVGPRGGNRWEGEVQIEALLGGFPVALLANSGAP